MQLAQQIFVVEEWVKDAHNEAWAEANHHAEVTKSLGTLKQENKELANQLILEEKARRSTKVGLKNAQDRAKDQHKKLYLIEIELATQKQLVLELRAKLVKSKATARMAEEATMASRLSAYEQRVQDTEARLADKLFEVCRDYYKDTWQEALNLAEVLVDSEWREARNIHYHPDIRKVLANLPRSPALAPLAIEKPLTAEALLPPLKVSKDPNQVGDQGQGAEKAKEKGKGKEVQALPEAKDAATKAKEAEDKSKDAVMIKVAPIDKEDPPPRSKA